MATSRICSIPDCDKPALSRGWCSMHYQRWKKHRDPMALKYPSHARDFYERTVLTYDKDDCLFWPYAKNPQGYGLVAHEGRQRSVHLIGDCIFDKPVGTNENGAPVRRAVDVLNAIRS